MLLTIMYVVDCAGLWPRGSRARITLKEKHMVECGGFSRSNSFLR